MPEDAISKNLASAIDEVVETLDAWDEEFRTPALQLKSAVERFHSEALRRLVGSLNQHTEARAALREAVNDPLVYAMLRQHKLLKPALSEQVMSALDSIRPSLRQHGGDVELIRIDAPGHVLLRLIGNCDSCGSSDVTVEHGIKKALQDRCDWIDTISVEGSVAGQSPDLNSDIDVVRIISPFEERIAVKSAASGSNS